MAVAEQAPRAPTKGMANVALSVASVLSVLLAYLFARHSGLYRALHIAVWVGAVHVPLMAVAWRSIVGLRSGGRRPCLSASLLCSAWAIAFGFAVGLGTDPEDLFSPWFVACFGFPGLLAGGLSFVALRLMTKEHGKRVQEDAVGHSRAGIASLVVFSVTAAVVGACCYASAALPSPHWLEDWILALCYVLPVSLLVGLVLGIAGLCGKQRRRGFAWAGAVLNGVCLALVVWCFAFLYATFTGFPIQ